MSRDEVEKTLRDWVTQEVNQRPICVTFLETQSFELKSGLIHLLRTFRDLENEDPCKFLKKFHVVCSRMKPHAVTEDQIKLRAFPFSLHDSARKWLYELPSGSITKREVFSKKRDFPVSKDKSLGSNKEKDKLYIVIGINDSQLYNFFCEDPTPMDWHLINSSSGGSLGDMTPTEIKELIEKLAIDCLILTKEKAVVKKPCGMLWKTEHLADVCLILQEDVAPKDNNFNNHRVFSIILIFNPISRIRILASILNQQPNSRNVALEDIETKSNIKNLEQQVSQLATSVGHLEFQGKLMGHIENNLKHNVSSISLRSGKTYGGPSSSEP
uniref:Retrotransposon gag domain-containing protein n=1 Tax=Lactuca sativa TaxID=4236 RepID=A0A9R1WSW5_LACSA|nr:hypothetical protein LSAT_V11C100031780 [Lactuca sativa]